MIHKRLILLFDGTWNDPDDNTNVYRLLEQIPGSAGEVTQLTYYDEGVGTSRNEKLLGGLTGYGLDKNLRDGYQWLAKRYTPDCQIWIFGFSRGAYTARSLVGLIRKSGLPKNADEATIKQAMALYRNKNIAPDDQPAKEFRQQHGDCARVHFLGVWDTVGALGIPGTVFSEHGTYSWHDTELSSIVDHAYHAMALDEHRAAYDAPLWVSKDGQQKAQNIDVEQRWFIGAHANIGGGYPSPDPLARIAYDWIVQKARAAGLKIEPLHVAENAWRGQPQDSYWDFMLRLYGVFRTIKCLGNGRHYRPLRGKDNNAVNVTIDPSVWQRWQNLADYRPPTLLKAGLTPPTHKQPHVEPVI